MAKVLGLGGVFFKSKDPKTLAGWYAEWLGLAVDPSYNGVSFPLKDANDEAYNVWGVFDASTDYFDPSPQQFMINLMVDDLDGMLARVAEGGGTVVGETQDYEYGRFGWFLDPDGNKVELWQPS